MESSQGLLPERTDLRSGVESAGERIVKAVAIAKAQGDDLERISAPALFYHTCREFRSARDMESHVQAAVNSLPRGDRILELNHVVESQELVDFCNRYVSELSQLNDHLLLIL